jgi:hypothetical protein
MFNCINRLILLVKDKGFAYQSLIKAISKISFGAGSPKK